MKKILKFIFALVVLIFALYAYSRYIEPNMLTVKTINVLTEKKINDFKAVFFTDTHFGE